MITLYEHLAGGPLRRKPRYVCSDGFSVSIQADEYAYCYPRESGLGSSYKEVELGFPSEAPPDYIMEYAEDDSDPTGTVYAFVPTDLVQRMLDEHNLKGIS